MSYLQQSCLPGELWVAVMCGKELRQRRLEAEAVIQVRENGHLVKERAGVRQGDSWLLAISFSFCWLVRVFDLGLSYLEFIF